MQIQVPSPESGHADSNLQLWLLQVVGIDGQLRSGVELFAFSSDVVDVCRGGKRVGPSKKKILF